MADDNVLGDIGSNFGRRRKRVGDRRRRRARRGDEGLVGLEGGVVEGMMGGMVDVRVRTTFTSAS
jgi:membrane protein implicated in regulation of membrane protease activity